MVPVRIRCSEIGPTAVRVSRETGWPTCRQQTADDVLAALVQDDLDDGLPGVGVDDLERVDDDRAVLQLDAAAQPAVQVARHGAGDLGEVGLGYLVGRVGQPVGELAVVGDQQQALGVLVQPAHVDEAAARGRRACRRASCRPRSSLIAVMTPKGLFIA